MNMFSRWYICCCGGLLLAFAGMRVQNTHHSPAATSDIYRQTITRVVNHTEPLCREFFPDYDTLRFQAEPNHIFYKNGNSRHIWRVDCLDAKGNPLAHVLWDEDRQRLFQIGRSSFSTHTSVRDSRAPAVCVSDSRAISTGREWAIRLHLANHREIQNSRTLLRHYPDEVSVKFYLPRHTIRITLAANTGEVQGVYACDLAEPSALPATDTPALHA